MALQRDPRLAARTIRFYRWSAPRDANGAEVAVDIRSALEAIDQLPFVAGGRYLELDGGDANCAWVDDTSGATLRLRLGTLRRGDWPQIEQAGRLTEMEAAPDASVAESVHIVFFDNHIVGSEFNVYGPRLRSRLPAYLTDRVGVPALTLLPIIRENVADRLDAFTDIRLLRLRLPPGYFARSP